MNPELLLKTKKLVIHHEGKKNFPYVDTLGNTTIGIGYNLTSRGLSDEWIDQQCNEDIAYFYEKLSDFSWFSKLNDARQIALVDMCFMGFKKFLTFKKMIAYLAKHDYDSAAFELLNSNYAKQVGKRAVELSNIIKTGHLVV